MGRLPRIVLKDTPHHVVQRGNRKQKTFFEQNDYRVYLEIMRQNCDANGVEVLAYCLMPNHSHLVAVPSEVEALAKAIGDAHKRYTSWINERFGWQGCLWQGRFFSCPLDEQYLANCVRYIEQNPVSANMCKNPWDYKWSSARPHLEGVDDVLVKVAPMLNRFGNWIDFHKVPLSDECIKSIVENSKTGRPLGSDSFVEKIEMVTGLTIAKQKPGPKKNGYADLLL